MLDFSHVPNSQQDRQILYATVGSNTWQTWNKPRGAKMIQIMCVGAGGGGASGVNGGVYNWGGGGGASGGITKLLIPAFIIPDTLYIQVGIGGIGGAGRLATGQNGLAGGKGTDSIISITPTGSATLTNSVLCIAPGGNGASNSNGGTTGGSGYSLGGTSTTYTSANSPLITLGLYTFEPTIAGRTATYANGAPDVYALSNSLVTGGAGGGSQTSYIAGNVYAASAFLLNNLLSPPQGTGLPAPNGYGILSPIFCGTGGCGGNGNNALAINSSNGGNGFYGCGGGGGGGGGNTNISSGVGGNGGDGIVFITSIF